jgi:hypothetical protein
VCLRLCMCGCLSLSVWMGGGGGGEAGDNALTAAAVARHCGLVAATAPMYGPQLDVAGGVRWVSVDGDDHPPLTTSALAVRHRVRFCLVWIRLILLARFGGGL